jgi:hypothetical protein
MQIRCWKKTREIDLTSSGGHEARFPGRRVFPLRFILRHYPIRGQTHGARKVFQERRNRFREQERARGWHVQYDQLEEGVSFLRDPATLTAYDPDVLRLSLTLGPRYPEDIEEALGATRFELAGAQCGLADTRSQIDAMRAEIERASTHIEKVTAQLTQSRAELRAREAESAALRSGLELRSAELARTRAEMLAELDARSALIEAMGREIETASTHIEHVTATLARTRDEVRARDIEAAALRRSLEHRTKDLADTRAAARAELEARSAHIAALVEAINRRSSDIHELTRQRDALQRSLSWRWTAPARAIARMLKGS